MFLLCSYAPPKPLSLNIWYARSLRDKPSWSICVFDRWVVHARRRCKASQRARRSRGGGIWDGSNASLRPPCARFRATAAPGAEASAAEAVASSVTIWCSMRSNRSLNCESFAADLTLQVLYLAPNLGDRGAGFGLHCIETGLKVSEGSGILRAQTLRGVHMRRGRVKSFGRNSSAVRIWTN